MPNLTRAQQLRTDRLMPGGIPRHVRIYDNDGRSIDRYTVVFSGNNPRFRHPYMIGWGSRSYPILAMSDNPFYAQGFCQHDSYPQQIDRPSYGHLGRKIKFTDLNADCQRAVLDDYRGYWDLPNGAS